MIATTPPKPPIIRHITTFPTVPAPPHRRIALVDYSGKLPRRELAATARALTIQVNRDFRRFWNVPAVQVRWYRWAGPTGVSQIALQPGWSGMGATTGGIHVVDQSGRPVAMVWLAAVGSDWPFAASHELLEELVDPNGTGNEVCDPVEQIGYRIGGIAVSDFVLPSYFANGPPPFDALQQLTTT